MIALDLEVAPGAELIEYAPEDGAPMPFGVMLGEDLLGMGDTVEEAVAEARKQIEHWELNK